MAFSLLFLGTPDYEGNFYSASSILGCCYRCPKTRLCGSPAATDLPHPRLPTLAVVKLQTVPGGSETAVAGSCSWGVPPAPHLPAEDEDGLSQAPSQEARLLRSHCRTVNKPPDE